MRWNILRAVFTLINSKKKISFISQIYDRDGRGCWYCTVELLPLDQIVKTGGDIPDNYPTIEHVIPRVIGGGDKLANLRVSCPECNNAKGYQLPEELMTDMSVKQLLGMLRTMTGKNMKLLVEIKSLKNTNKVLRAQLKEAK